MCLEDLGWKPTHAGDVSQALSLARSQNFDIILSDLGLPDGSGLQIGQELGARLPVVALSGYGTEADLRRTADAGFSAHVVKPADPEAIHEALVRALTKWRDSGPS